MTISQRDGEEYQPLGPTPSGPRPTTPLLPGRGTVALSPSAQWLRERDERSRGQLQASTEIAQKDGLDQERASRVLRASARAGLPEDFVRENLDKVERAMAQADFNPETFRRQSPALAEWAAQSPSHAALIEPDREAFGTYEASMMMYFEAHRRASNLSVGVARGVPTGFARGAEMTGKGMPAWLSSLNELVYRGGFGWWLPESARQADQAITGFLFDRRRSGAIGEALAGRKRWDEVGLGRLLNPFGAFETIGEAAGNVADFLAPNEEQRSYASDVAEGVGQLAWQILVARGAGGVAHPTSLVNLASMGAFIQTEMLADAERRGINVDPELRAAAIALGGTATALTERVGLWAIVERAPPPLRRALARGMLDVLIAGGAEAVQEMLDQVLQNTIARGLYDPEQNVWDNTVLYEGAVGFGAGAVIRSLMHAFVPGVRGVRGRYVGEALADLDGHLGRIHLRESDPEAFEDVVKAISARAGADSIWVNAEAWQRYYQEVGQDPAQMADEILGEGGREQLIEAAATSGRMRIPIEKYARHLAGSEAAQVLRQDMSFSHDDPTPREAVEWGQTQQALLAEYERQVEQSQSPEARALYDQVLGDLLGVHERSTAEVLAKLHTGAILRLSEMSGMTPQEFYERNPIQFQREVPEVLREIGRIDTVIDPMLDRLRAGEIPSETEAFGPSLFDFLLERGGIQEVGETRALRGIRGRPGQGMLVSPRGMDLDTAAELAADAGYLAVRDVDQLLEALESEEGGQRVFSLERENRQIADQRRQLLAMQQGLESMQVDIDRMTNEEIKRILRGEMDAQAVEAARKAIEGDAQTLAQRGASLLRQLTGDDGTRRSESRKPLWMRMLDRLDQSLSRREARRRTPQTQTPEFRRWFGQSQVVNAQGEPMVVYHGTRPGTDITEFQAPSERDGIYFTPDPEYAEGFTNELGDPTFEPRGSIYPAYLSIQRPYIVEAEPGTPEWENFVQRGLDRQPLEAEGYDGAILREPGGAIDQVVAFRPEQIKSATANVGTFSMDSANILYQLVEDASRLLAEEGINSRIEKEFFGDIWPRFLAQAGEQFDPSSDGIERAAERSVREIANWLKTNEKFANYYTRDWGITRSILDEHYGIKLTDEQFAVFRFLAGVNSLNTPLAANIQDAVNGFELFLRDGNFNAIQMTMSLGGATVVADSPYSISNTTNAHKARAMRVLDQVAAQEGGYAQAIEWLMEPVPYLDLHKINRQLGYKGDVGEIGFIQSLNKQAVGQDTDIPRMFVLGPKIGAYTMNALGDGRYTTIDIWESRYIRSQFNGLLKKNYGLPDGKAEQELFVAFNDAFERQWVAAGNEPLQKSAYQAARWFYILEKTREAGYSEADTSETISYYTAQALGAAVPGGDPASGRPGYERGLGAVQGRWRPYNRKRSQFEKRSDKYKSLRRKIEPGRRGRRVDPRVFSRRDARNRQGVIAEFTVPIVKDNVHDQLRKLEVSQPMLLQLNPAVADDSGVVGADRFHAAVEAARAGNIYGAALPALTPAEYSKMKLFLTEDGTAGVAVNSQGEIATLFNSRSGPHHNIGRHLILMALEAGATRAVMHDTAMIQYLQSMGFEEVGRRPWDEAQKPEGWSKLDFFEWSQGEPDTVTMEYAKKQRTVTLYQDDSFVGRRPPMSEVFVGDDVSSDLRDVRSNKSRSIIVEMPIQTFLGMAEAAEPFAAKAQGVRALQTFSSLPFLKFDMDGDVASVTGHEGRHRARELLRRGYTTMPVLLRGPIRWDQQQEGNFDYVETWPQTMRSEDGVFSIPFMVERGQWGDLSSLSNETLYQDGDLILGAFRSKAERVLADMPPKTKLGAEQWLATLRNKGVKAEEIQWLGLREWLDGFGGVAVTAAEVADYIRANRLQIEEVRYGGAQEFVMTREDFVDEFNSIAESSGFPLQAEIDPQTNGVFYAPHGLDHNINARGEVVTSEQPPGDPWTGSFNFDTAFRVMRLDRSDWEAELARIESLREMLEESLSDGDDGVHNTYRPMDVINGTYGELVLTLPGVASEGAYTTPHWPGVSNPVGHIRIGEMRPIKGEGRRLHVIEIQSDWHQEGRDGVYFREGAPIPGFQVTVDGDRKEAYSFLHREQAERSAEAVMERMAREGVDAEVTIVEREFAPSDPEYRYLSEEIGDGNLVVPDAPFKKTWPEMLVKRIVAYAAENGYTEISFPNGLELQQLVGGRPEGQHYFYQKMVEGIADKMLLKLGSEKLSDDNVENRENLQKASARLMAAQLAKKGTPVTAYQVYGDIRPGQKMTESQSAFYATRERAENSARIFMEARPGVKVEVVERELTPDHPAYDDIAELQPDLPVRRPVYTITDQVRSAAEAGFDLYQNAPAGGARGAIEMSPRDAQGKRAFRVILTDKANLSTTLHELGHYYFEILADLSEMPEATDQVRQDYRTLLEYLGKERREDVTREDHERMARSFEAYLMEGKSPSLELAGAFARIRSWMLQVYRMITRLEVDLNPQVRDVFDRLLATQEEIQLAREANDMADPLFNTAEEAMMTPEEFEAYLRASRRASEEATTGALRAVMAPIIRRQKAWYKELKRKVRQQVEDELNQEPVYQALAFLQRGTMADGSPLPDGVEATKLSRDALVDMYGKEFLKRLPRPYVYSKDGGVHPDFIAELFGFDSGDALVQALVNARHRRRLAEAETERRMQEQYPDAVNDGTIGQEAETAIMSGRYGEVLLRELRSLEARSRGQAQSTISIMRAAAQRILQDKTLQHLQPSAYRRAAARYSREARDAMLTGDLEAARRAKRQQLMNHELFREATRIAEAIESGRNYLQRLTKPSARARIGKAGEEYVDQIYGLIERYELARVPYTQLRRRQSLLEFVNQLEDDGADIGIEPAVLDEARRVNYRQVPFSELQGVFDAVRQLDHQARLKVEFKTKRERIAFEAVVGELVEAARENAGERPKRPLDPNMMSWFDRLKDGFSDIDASLLKIEQLVLWMDGDNIDGPWNRYFWRPIAQAQFEKMDLMNSRFAELRSVLDRLSREKRLNLLERVHIQSLGESVTRDFIMGVALNMGTESGRARVISDSNFTQEQVSEMLDHLTAEEIGVVQQVWDTFDSLWGDISDMQFRVTGIRPQKLEAVPLELKAGTLAGGYFPVVYDPNSSAAGMQQEGERLRTAGPFERGAVFATTPRGHTKQRVEGYHAKMLFSLGNIPNRLARHIHDLTHREAVMNAHRILMDKQVRAAIQDTLGPNAHRIMYSWLKRQANDAAFDVMDGLHGVKAIMERLRLNTSVVIMGLKATTMMSQFAGYADAGERIGSKWLSDGMAEFYKNPAAAIKFATEKSGEIRHRFELKDLSVREQIQRLKGKTDIRSKATKFFFMNILVADKMVATGVWIGAYKKAISEGRSEESAREYGDSVVRLSQGASGTKDLSAIQATDQALLRWMGLFYTYFSAKYSRIRSMGRRAGRVITKGEMDQVPLLLAQVWWGTFLPAVLSEIFAGRGPDEDDNWFLWAMQAWWEFPFLTVIGIRDLASPAFDQILGWRNRPFESSFQLTPVGEVGTTTLRAARTAADAFQGEADLDEVLLRGFEASGYLFGLPTSQAKITGRYLIELAEGEQPESFQEFLRNIAFTRRD